MARWKKVKASRAFEREGFCKMEKKRSLLLADHPGHPRLVRARRRRCVLALGHGLERAGAEGEGVPLAAAVGAEALAGAVIVVLKFFLSSEIFFLVPTFSFFSLSTTKNTFSLTSPARCTPCSPWRTPSSAGRTSRPCTRRGCGTRRSSRRR